MQKKQGNMDHGEDRRMPKRPHSSDNKNGLSNGSRKSAKTVPATQSDKGQNTRLSDFFVFSGASQVEATPPNAITAEIQNNPSGSAPQKARYNCHTNEEEFKYGDDRDTNAQTIPLTNQVQY